MEKEEYYENGTLKQKTEEKDGIEKTSIYREDGSKEEEILYQDDDSRFEHTVILYDKNEKVLEKSSEISCDGSRIEYYRYDEERKNFLFNFSFSKLPIWDDNTQQSLEYVIIHGRFLNGQSEEEFLQQYPTFKNKIEQIKWKLEDYSKGYVTAEELQEYYVIDLYFSDDGKIQEKRCDDKDGKNFEVTKFNEKSDISSVEVHVDGVVTKLNYNYNENGELLNVEEHAEGHADGHAEEHAEGHAGEHAEGHAEGHAGKHDLSEISAAISDRTQSDINKTTEILKLKKEIGTKDSKDNTQETIDGN